MNNVMRSLKLTSVGIPGIITRNLKLEAGTNRFCSTLWNTARFPSKTSSSLLARTNQPIVINSQYSTASNRDEIRLDEFLDQEIAAEQEQQKSKTIPSKIDDFEVTLDGAQVRLTKQTPVETIEVSFNVNHSIEEPAEPDVEGSYVDMVSKPEFDVNIKRGDTTLGFSCSYLSSDEDGSNETGDLFAIDEVTIYKGEFDDRSYVVAGSLLDGCLYDLLMNLLYEKGITDSFVQKISEFAGAYEHSSYISLLRELKKFAS